MAEQATGISRRGFLKASATAGGAFLLGFHLPVLARGMDQEAVEAAFSPNAWVRIEPDGDVTVLVGSSEMGQGVMTAIPMLLAEELDADWQRVRAEFAPADAAYTNPIIGQQLTGGSTAVRGFWRPVREAGAAAREMLVAAAAGRWGVDVAACTVESGVVRHDASGRSAGFGELAAAAAEQPVPDSVFLKDPDQFTLLGRPAERLDVPQKVTGEALFGQDVQVPGAWVASIEHPPVFGGKVKRWDGSKSRQINGVNEILEVESGVSVLADGFWKATKGREALEVEWDLGPNAGVGSEDIRGRFRRAVGGGTTVRKEGQGAAGGRSASKTLEADYEVPFLAHACMEPMNCTADVRADGCDVWVPTQAQTRTQQTAMAVTGLPKEKVRVHTTFLGGGFGRRSEQDFVREAVDLSQRVGRPIKLMWTREDDIRHDYYRPATYNRFAGAVDDDGMPVLWSHGIAGPSIMSRVSPSAVKNGVDNTSVEGAANLPYSIPDLEVRYALVDTPVPVGFWRSVGSSQNAFVTECFLDELAALGGRDPFQVRRALLADRPRHKRVLERAAEAIGWDNGPPKGRHRGIAVAKSFGSYAAQAAEVSVEAGEVRVHRVTCAIDCGRVVNPDTIRAQMESGIVYGLTAALKGAITLKDGRVEQSNFHDYRLLALDEMPEVEVDIIDSEADPGGVGEPGTPPIAPAVANAVFAATGKPVRRLPIRLA
ncbi:MAG TPA: xanthine dehydrogenase family protein molybdopterin-binding subunit [Gammaproteobacteria bacterium]|nr:xanthine dehydrogenase family protein molybdopterin-binding subunit [Gammaproteobacteria bacterium]